MGGGGGQEEVVGGEVADGDLLSLSGHVIKPESGGVMPGTHS